MVQIISSSWLVQEIIKFINVLSNAKFVIVDILSSSGWMPFSEIKCPRLCRCCLKYGDFQSLFFKLTVAGSLRQF